MTAPTDNPTPARITFANGEVFRALHFEPVNDVEYVALGLFDDGSGVEVLGHAIHILFPMTAVRYVVLLSAVESEAEELPDGIDIDKAFGGSE